MASKTFRIRTLRRVMIDGEAQPVGAVVDVDGVAVAGMLDSRAVELVHPSDADAVQAAVRSDVARMLRSRPPESPAPLRDERWQPVGVGVPFYK